MQHTARWGYEDVLENVSDVVETVRAPLLPSAIEAVTLLNGKTGKKSVCAMPVTQQIEPICV